MVFINNKHQNESKSKSKRHIQSIVNVELATVRDNSVTEFKILLKNGKEVVVLASELSYRTLNSKFFIEYAFFLL